MAIDYVTVSKLPTRQILIQVDTVRRAIISKLPTRQILVLYHTLNRVAT